MLMRAMALSVGLYLLWTSSSLQSLLAMLCGCAVGILWPWVSLVWTSPWHFFRSSQESWSGFHLEMCPFYSVLYKCQLSLLYMAMLLKHNHFAFKKLHRVTVLLRSILAGEHNLKCIATHSVPFRAYLWI